MYNNGNLPRPYIQELYNILGGDMRIDLYTDMIVELAQEIRATEAEIEKVKLFTSLRTLVYDIEKHNRESNNDNGYIKEKITQLLWSAQTLARLNSGNNHSDDQHIVWLIGAINTIKSNINSYE